MKHPSVKEFGDLYDKLNKQTTYMKLKKYYGIQKFKHYRPSIPQKFK